MYLTGAVSVGTYVRYVPSDQERRETCLLKSWWQSSSFEPIYQSSSKNTVLNVSQALRRHFKNASRAIMSFHCFIDHEDQSYRKRSESRKQAEGRRVRSDDTLVCIASFRAFHHILP